MTAPPVPYAHESCRVIGCACGNLARQQSAEAPVPSDTDRPRNQHCLNCGDTRGGPYIVDGCVVYGAQQLTDALKHVWKYTPAIIDERDQLKDQLGVLQGRLTTAEGLHQPERRYTPNLAESCSFDTPEEAAEYDDIEIELVAHFDVCAHCGPIEMGDGDRDYRESLWPCATARALGLGGEATDGG